MTQLDLFNDYEPEHWLPVIGYEGSFEVSDQGRVRSVDGRSGAQRAAWQRRQAQESGVSQLTIPIKPFPIKPITQFNSGLSECINFEAAITRRIAVPRGGICACY